jgi:hypothetical protein
MINIDKGIEIPKQRAGRPSGPATAMYLTMEVGDSVFLTTNTMLRICGEYSKKRDESQCNVK